MNEEQTNNVPTEVKKSGIKKYSKSALWILLIAGLCYGCYYFFFNGNAPKEESAPADTTAVVADADTATIAVADTTKKDSVK